MQYEFTDLNPRGEPVIAPMGIEAVSYNGHLLDKEIQGFITLSVEGRDSFTRDINSAESSGDGSIYLSSRLDERELVVNFYFEASNVNDYNDRMQTLKNILREPNGAIAFADDPQHHYYGTPALSVDAGTLTPTGQITFTLNDPFKYSQDKIISVDNTTELTVQDVELVFPQLPKQITLTVKDGASLLAIANNLGQSFKTTSGIGSGDNIVIDFENLVYSVNQQDQTGNVALISNFGDFNIASGTILKVNVTCDIKLEYAVKSI